MQTVHPNLNSAKHKLVFVCLGNICRSPLAEGIMLHLINKYNLACEVDSAGTASYHVGEKPDSRTIRSAQKNGIDLSALRARQFSREDFGIFDQILVMDKSNLKNVLSLATSDAHKQKVNLFLNAAHNQESDEVPDPYYGSEQDFDAVFNLVFGACEQLCLSLKTN